jgi:NADP-dependent 3-hydroxy acid dehydrogenase YdfG
VTGAARGIGADAAARLVSRGMRVALLDVRADAVRSTAARLGSAALPIVADVTDLQAMIAAVDATEARFGRLDVAVANAAVAPARPLAADDGQALRDTLDVNVVGVANTVAAALPPLVEQAGYVLVVGSLAAAVHLPLMGAYAASKAAVEAYADVLRLELAGSGVDVGVASFGFVDTELLREGLASPAAAGLAHRSPLLFAHLLDVEQAGSAVVHAVRGRRPSVLRPRRLWPLLSAARLLRPGVELYVRRTGAPHALPQASSRDDRGGTAG